MLRKFKESINSKKASRYNPLHFSLLLKGQLWVGGAIKLFQIVTAFFFNRKLIQWFQTNKSAKLLCFNHYENMPIQTYRISTPKTQKFSDKNPDIFHISTQNIDCGYSLEPPRRGGSNEYPQSMLFSKIRKIMYTPVNPSFTI